MEDVRISFWYLLALLHINVWVTRCNMTPELTEASPHQRYHRYTHSGYLVKCLSAIRRFESNIEHQRFELGAFSELQCPI